MRPNKEAVINILFCGTGGQGVLKASEVCAWAAVFDGFHVKKSEVHGMAQRGGSVQSHLRFGPIVFSPLIPQGQVDFLISFDQQEARRLVSMLKPSGFNGAAWLEAAQQAVDDRKFLNTYMLGMLSRQLSIQKESWLCAFDTVFSHAFFEKNKDAFLKGRGG